jgi:hypothetical protein
MHKFSVDDDDYDYDGGDNDNDNNHNYNTAETQCRAGIYNRKVMKMKKLCVNMNYSACVNLLIDRHT